MLEKRKYTLEEYEQLLKNHDWFYTMSDDARVYREGLKKEKLILEQSLTSKEHEKLYLKHSKKYERATNQRSKT